MQQIIIFILIHKPSKNTANKMGRVPSNFVIIFEGKPGWLAKQEKNINVETLLELPHYS